MEVCTLKIKKQKLVFITGFASLTVLFFLISVHVAKAADEGGIGRTVGWALNLIFDGGLQSTIKENGQEMWKVLSNIISQTFIQQIMNAFAGVACSILILQFAYSAVMQASKDLLSLEKLVIMTIKLLAAFCFLLYLPEIIDILVRIGKYFFYWSGGSSVTADSSKMEFMTGDGVSPYNFKFFGCDTVDQAISTGAIFDKKGDGFSTSVGSYIKNADLLLICAIPGIICLVCRIAGVFLVISNGLMILVRIILSPFPVAQIFSENGKDVGGKYLRSLLAELLTMAGMMIVLWAASRLQGGMVSMSLSGITNITSGNIREVLAWKNLIIICVPQLAAIGGMAGAGKLMREVTGA
jgi:membrane protein